MLRVTFDTLVAEHADGAALIDAAWCEGYNVVLVGTSQAAVEPPSYGTGDEPGGAPAGPQTALALSIHLCHVTGDDSRELTAAASYSPLRLTIEPEMMPILGHLPKLPQQDWRQDKEIWVVGRFWEILRLLSSGSGGLRSGSRSFTPMHQRWFRAAGSLAIHAYLRRHLFVSDLPDVSSRGGRRQALSRLLNTRLMTTDECRSWLTRQQRRRKRHGEAGWSWG